MFKRSLGLGSPVKISRNFVRAFVFVFGPMVLLSYVVGVGRMDDPVLLWGGIPESWRPWNVTCMFIAAAGFLIVWWKYLYAWDEEAVESLTWPWTQTDGIGGNAKILFAMVLILIPSMLWLELTRIHIEHDSNLTQAMVIGNLWLVVLGNLILILLGWNAWKSDINGTDALPFVGSLLFGIQVILNDGMLWVWKYPW
tara:strand:+ start:10981 stop:11571 length:591 start_codon:yes stop_codon:yes gene_type:complete